jgi:hypothetical protein
MKVLLLRSYLLLAPAYEGSIKALRASPFRRRISHNTGIEPYKNAVVEP